MHSALSGRRILLVEDEMMVAFAVEDMLTRLGCAVVGPAARVNQALAIIQSETVDAAVLDINLNGEESYSVADALTAQGVPFVFSTGYHKNSLQDAYVSRPLLQKPYDRSRLGAALEKLLTPQTTADPWPRSISTVWDANRLRIATDAAGVALWSWRLDTDELAMDERAHAMWGVGGGPVTFEDLSARIHPADLDRVRTGFNAMRRVLGHYEVDFRILLDEEIRWISTRGRGEDVGTVGRIMFGVFLDVTERKSVEEAREMLAGEMGHRVKNLFAIASALTTIAARSTTTTAEMARDLTQRLTALDRAHDLVRPIPTGPKRTVLLGDLLGVLLAPYTENGDFAERVRISVPLMVVGSSSITTLALVVHELATNSLKYGALSKQTGTLDVECVVNQEVAVFTWTERGGPPVAANRGSAGFGSQLINKSISNQFGGTVSFDWPPEGAVVTLRMRQELLAI